MRGSRVRVTQAAPFLPPIDLHGQGDLIETALIVLALVALGVFPEKWAWIDADWLGPPSVMPWLLAASFLLPPAWRDCFNRTRRTAR